MKKMSSFLIVLCASCLMAVAQDYSYNAFSKKFELSQTDQLFFGEGGLKNAFGVGVGYRLHPDWALRTSFSWQTGNDWESHLSWVADIGVARVIRNEGLKNMESHIAFGGGYVWDRSVDGTTGKILGMVEIENRFYVSPRSYLGTTIKAYAGKNYAQASFLGISWGIRF